MEPNNQKSFELLLWILVTNFKEIIHVELWPTQKMIRGILLKDQEYKNQCGSTPQKDVGGCVLFDQKKK